MAGCAFYLKGSPFIVLLYENTIDRKIHAITKSASILFVSAFVPRTESLHIGFHHLSMNCNQIHADLPISFYLTKPAVINRK